MFWRSQQKRNKSGVRSQNTEVRILKAEGFRLGAATLTRTIARDCCLLSSVFCLLSPDFYAAQPRISSAATSLAPKIFRSTSSIARASTEIERLIDSSYSKSPTIDWMLPSKINPTSSRFLFIVGEPLLPPVMSFVETKLNGVRRFINLRFAFQRGGRL